MDSDEEDNIILDMQRKLAPRPPKKNVRAWARMYMAGEEEFRAEDYTGCPAGIMKLIIVAENVKSLQASLWAIQYLGKLAGIEQDGIGEISHDINIIPIASVNDKVIRIDSA